MRRVYRIYMANFTWLVYKPTTQPFVLTLNAEPKTIGSELSLQSSILSLAAYSAHNTRDQRSRESPFSVLHFSFFALKYQLSSPPPTTRTPEPEPPNTTQLLPGLDLCSTCTSFDQRVQTWLFSDSAVALLGCGRYSFLSPPQGCTLSTKRSSNK